MKWVFISLVTISCSVNAQVALTIIKSSAVDIKKLKNISYNIYNETKYGTSSADITIQRDQMHAIFDVSSLKVTGIALDDQGSRQFQFSYDGNSFFFIDP